MLGTDDDKIVVVADEPFVMAEFVFSAILDKRHKFVVCTKPRSKLKHSKIAAPIELRRVTIDETIVHLFNCGSYFSTEFNDELPSFPPNAYNRLSIWTTSCVDLQIQKK